MTLKTKLFWLSVGYDNMLAGQPWGIRIRWLPQPSPAPVKVMDSWRLHLFLWETNGGGRPGYAFFRRTQ